MECERERERDPYAEKKMRERKAAFESELIL